MNIKPNFISLIDQRFKDSSYLLKTKREFVQKPSVSPFYQLKTKERTSNVSQKIFAGLLPLKALAERCILPASMLSITRGKHQSFFPFIKQKYFPEKISDHADLPEEQKKDYGNGWKYKRFTVRVDGLNIDATVMAQESTLHNGRWVLNSLGNIQLYEQKIKNSWRLKRILKQTGSNAVLFNYPGVESSSGEPRTKTLVKAYQTMLKFLETEVKAKEIIGYGYSIGGGVQGESLKTHSFKDGIRYLFIKDRSFSSLARVVSSWTGLGFLLPALGWSLNSIDSSRRLSSLGIPEIIMQTTGIDRRTLVSDGVISVNASQAKAVWIDSPLPLHNKHFIGLGERHRTKLSNGAIKRLSTRINQILSQ